MKYSLYLIVLILIYACQRDVPADGESRSASTGSSRLSELLRDDGSAGFPKAIEPRSFDFPGDHGAHEAYRNEWWYFTGNLDGDNGGRFGYELTLFRFSLAATDARDTGSAWQTNQVYIGHFAITDADSGDFHVAQRYSRGAAGLSGTRSTPFAVWLEDWRIDGTGDDFPWRIRASDGDMAIDLEVAPRKPVILNGERGLSRKSAEPGNASYYYSVPRLDTAGTLTVGGTSIGVTGLSWLDREWGSSALSPDQEGWDWFALQLSDGTDLMFYTLRQQGGMIDPHSSGTWISADGRAEALQVDDVRIDVLGTWESATGGRYPSAWRIVIPDKALDVEVTPVLADQELVTNVRYWEGAVDVTGTMGARSLTGRGYVELTGYARD
jgi:predicted secreted hydrolase